MAITHGDFTGQMPRAYGVNEKVGVQGPKYPGIWIVKKVNQTSYNLERQGDGARLRCDKMLVTEPPSEAEVSDVRFPMPLMTVVRYTGTSAKIPHTLFVVHKDTGDGPVNVIKLGGDGGRYWRIPAGHLAIVDPAEVVAAYQAAGGTL